MPRNHQSIKSFHNLAVLSEARSVGGEVSRVYLHKYLAPTLISCQNAGVELMSAELIANAIIAAVTAGATTGATDTAKKAVGDAYSGLKSLLIKKFGSANPTVKAVESLEAEPDSKG